MRATDILKCEHCSFISRYRLVTTLKGGAAMMVSPLRLFAAVLLLVRCSELSMNAAHNHKHSSMQLPSLEDKTTLHCVDSSGKFYAEAVSKDGRATRVVVSPIVTNAGHAFTLHAAGSPVSMSVSMSGAVAILTRDDNGKVVCNVYSQRRDRPVFHIACGGYSSGVSFSPDGSLLAVGTSTNGMVQSQRVEIFSTRSFKRIRELRGFYWGHVSAIAFSPDGKHIAAASISGESLQGELLEWDLTTGKKEFEVSQQGNVKEDVDDGLLAFISNSDILCGHKRYQIGRQASTNIPLTAVDDIELKGVCRLGKDAILVSEDLDRHCMVLTEITSRADQPAREIKLSAGETIVSVCANTATVYIASKGKKRNIRLGFRNHKITVETPIP
jgi:WD40 repeat protein